MKKTKTGYLSRIISNQLAQIGLLLMVLVAGFSFLGPFLAPYTPSEFIGTPYGLPADGAPFGTDNLGRDVLSRVMNGGQNLVWMAFCATLLGLSLGTLIGLCAAYFRGTTEVILMRLVELKLAFPSVVFALMIVTVFGSGKLLLTIVVGISQAPSVARVMRGTAMSVVRQDFIQWARSTGMPAWRVIWSEVLPNTTSPLLVEFGLRMMWSISLLAGLSFLGYGIQPPAADWGLMVNENRNALAVQPYAVLMPISLIAVFAVGCNLFAEGVSRAIGRIGSDT